VPEMSRTNLHLVLLGVAWVAAWPLYLGIAGARSGQGIADYGPLLAVGALFLGGAVFLARKLWR
jgi:hypothetical protein